VKGPQHYVKHVKITLLVLLWYNSDVSFPILGYRYLNRAKISWAIGGGPRPPRPPSKYAHDTPCPFSAWEPAGNIPRWQSLFSSFPHLRRLLYIPVLFSDFSCLCVIPQSFVVSRAVAVFSSRSVPSYSGDNDCAAFRQRLKTLFLFQQSFPDIII